MISAVSMVELSFTGVLCHAGAGLGSATACISSSVVGQSRGWDRCAAGAAGTFLGFWSAPRVEWRGLHMSSVRSMIARLLDGVGSVFVSSQVRSMISCGDGAAGSVSCPVGSLCYGGTVAESKREKGTSPAKENRGKDPSACPRGPVALSSGISLPWQHS